MPGPCLSFDMYAQWWRATGRGNLLSIALGTRGARVKPMAATSATLGSCAHRYGLPCLKLDYIALHKLPGCCFITCKTLRLLGLGACSAVPFQGVRKWLVKPG